MSRSQGQDDAVPALRAIGGDILDDLSVPAVALHDFRIQSLDGYFLFIDIQRTSQRCEPGDDVMVERAFFRLRPRIVPVSNRPALHEQNRVVAVLSRGGRRKAVHIFGGGGFQDLFVGKGRSVVAFVGDDHSVMFHEVLDLSLSADRLHDRDIHNAVEGVFAPAQLPDEAGFFPIPLFFYPCRPSIR